MKTKEELINIMAKAAYSKPIHFKKPKWEDATPEARQGYIDSATIQLEALCRALPDAYGDLVNGEEINARFYNQLKEMGNET